MEDTTLVKRSHYGLYVQIISSGILAFCIALFATWMFSSLLHWAKNGGSVLIGLTWAVLIITWILASIKLWFDWRVKRYEVASDAFIVHAKAGFLGSARSIYRYESIISMRMSQSVFGKLFGYGDVYLTIPKLPEPVVMNDVEDPIHQLATIQQRLGERSGDGTTSALIN